jgi:hypothetical protein
MDHDFFSWAWVGRAQADEAREKDTAYSMRSDLLRSSQDIARCQ